MANAILSRLGKCGSLMLALCAIAAVCPAVTIKFTGRPNSFGPISVTCGRGDSSDVCTVTSYLTSGPGAARDNSSFIFATAWTKFKTANPAWTLVNGGTLNGTIEIWSFTTFNDCPTFGGGGVEIHAKFKPGTNDPANWVFAQAIADNYDLGSVPPHNSSPLPPKFEMDGSSPPVYKPDANGEFYDKPKANCIHNAAVYFHATCLVATADTVAKRLTTYEGFDYGFDYPCVHTPVPEPAVLPSFGLGLAFLFGSRRRFRRGKIAGV